MGILLIAVGGAIMLIASGYVAVPRREDILPRRNGAIRNGTWNGVERRKDSAWLDFQAYSDRLNEEHRRSAS